MKKIFFICTMFLCQLSVWAQLNTERILTIGRNALYFQDYVLSIQYFNQVIKLKPYLADPYFYRAVAKAELADYKAADEDFTEAIDRNPFNPMAYYGRGFVRRNMNFFKEAVSDFTKALEFSPDALFLLQSRIDAREQSEDYSGAMSDLEHYMRLNPKNIEMTYEKGRLQLLMKDTLGAELSFNNLIKADSTNTLGWSARAMLRMQRTDKKGALGDYSQAIKLKSSFAGDYINRGILNVQTKNYRQALSDYDTAIGLDKSSALAYYNRGLLRANLGDNNNALSDLKKVLQLDSANNEALLQKAELEQALGQYKNAISDYKSIISKYPYFIPAYLEIGRAYQTLGNEKEAFLFRQIADNIEKNKDQINRKIKLQATNKIATIAQHSTVPRKIDLFNRLEQRPEEDTDRTTSNSKHSEDDIHGKVQTQYADVVNEHNFVLTYYVKSAELRHTNTYYPLLDEYNKQKAIAPLKITNNEVPLTSELINAHFETINEISGKIAEDKNNADLFFRRALEFSMVQDFNSAIEDLNTCISLRPDLMLAYFCRANIRYKLVDYQKTTTSVNSLEEKDKKVFTDKQLLLDQELILSDYNKAAELNPDFSFVFFNKGNLLCTQKDFAAAITAYTKAISIDADFAEAYFNRGLTYLFVGQDDKGLADLSKAGELGIYASYNLLQRFKK